MRTSVTIDDDKFAEIKIRCFREKISFNQVVNDLLDKWMVGEEVQPKPQPKEEVKYPHRPTKVSGFDLYYNDGDD